MVITPDMLATIIFLMKAFGVVIVSLLSIITVLGGVIWNDLKNKLIEIRAESSQAIKSLKEDGQVKCGICSSRNKEDHDSIMKECEELWDAVEVCCPRGK